MKRAGNLWPQIVDWNNLLESALQAARGKKKRPDVARFLFQLEPNICELQRELEAGVYEPGGYRSFWIHDPKARLISAAPFRDRVVHHALTRSRQFHCRRLRKSERSEYSQTEPRPKGAVSA